MTGGLSRLLVGKPLPTSAAAGEKLTRPRAIGAFGLDALSSVAYGPDEILYVLILAGTMGTRLNFGVALAITALLVVVAISYRQTIFAYPRGGGSYTVARANLGIGPGLVAAAALTVDYVTTLAVSVTAGVEAIVSFAPAFDQHRVVASVGAIILLVLINLRGVKDAGAAFVLPTYIFVGSLGALLAWGIIRFVLLGETPPHSHYVPHAVEGVGLFLVLRAFAGGCTAMTGVEAIANGVPTFKKPAPVNAAATLLTLVAILAALFLGVVFLGNLVGAIPSDQSSVIAQIGDAVAGRSPLFYVVQIASAIILVLAANTPFNGFPLLAAVLAEDDFLPHQFSHRGARLAYSNGILFIGIVAGILVVAFRGSTHALIPLFAIGVFLCFTLSQAGMIVHWLKEGGRGSRLKLAVNGFGAAVTAAVTGIVVVTKFSQGAYIVIILVPILVGSFYAIHRHYRHERRQVLARKRPVLVSSKHRVLIVVGDINRAVAETLEFASGTSNDVSAIHVVLDEPEGNKFMARWEKWAPEIPIRVVESPFRDIVASVMQVVETMQADTPNRQLVVMIPDVVPAHWYQEILHNQTGLALAAALRHREGVALTMVPVQLE